MSENLSSQQTETKPNAGRPRKITTEVLKRAQELYDNQGLSVQKIASLDFCNVHPSTLYWHLTGKGKGDRTLDMRKKGRRGLTKEQKEYLATQFDAGRSLSALRDDPKLANHDGKRFALPTLSKSLKALGRQPQAGRPKKKTS